MHEKNYLQPLLSSYRVWIVCQYKVVQVRKATVIKKDDTELTRAYERYALEAGSLDDADNLVDTDISGEPAEVQAICTAVWTTDVKAAWKTKLIANKTEQLNFIYKQIE